MIDILIYVGGALAIAVVALLAYASRKPDEFNTSRATVIRAPAERIFPLINDLGAFNTWNPFNRDPRARIDYRGPAQGKGAGYDWAGDRNVGKGSLEILDSTPPSEIVMRLDMLKPMEAHNRVVFRLEPQGEATKVSWTMSGKQPFLGKLMSTFIDCEKMCGDEFERCLSALKARAEGEAAIGRPVRV